MLPRIILYCWLWEPLPATKFSLTSFPFVLLMPTITILGLLEANYTWLALEAVAWQRDGRRQGNANVLHQLHSHWPLNYAHVFSKNIFLRMRRNVLPYWSVYWLVFIVNLTNWVIWEGGNNWESDDCCGRGPSPLWAVSSLDRASGAV